MYSFQVLRCQRNGINVATGKFGKNNKRRFLNKHFSKHTDYIIETKHANIYKKKLLLTIFVKKSFFFRLKKNFDGVFFVEVTKKNEK